MDWREFVETLSAGRADAARGPGRRLRADGFRHARPLPPRGRGASRGCSEADRGRGRASRRSALAPARRGARARRRRRRARAATSATTSSTPAAPLLERAVGSAPLPARAACAAPLARTRRCSPTCGAVGRADAAVRRSARWRSAAAATAPALVAGAARWRCSLLLATSQLAVALVNWVATLLVAPRLLPRMDFSSGIPAESRTLVVVPTMLGSAARRRRAGRGARGALPRQPRSAPALRAADRLPRRAGRAPCRATTRWSRTRAARIEALNAERAPHEDDDGNDEPGRPSSCSTGRAAGTRASGVWMGYERKRGKLGDLNALLRGRRRGAGRRFSRVVGDIARARRRALRHHARHRHAAAARRGARSWSATMAHPLNRPRFDADAQRRAW